MTSASSKRKPLSEEKNSEHVDRRDAQRQDERNAEEKLRPIAEPTTSARSHAAIAISQSIHCAQTVGIE